MEHDPHLRTAPMSTPLEAALAAATAEDAPDSVALMRILMEAPGPEAAHDGLVAEMARQRARPEAVARLARLQSLWAAHPDAWGTVRAVTGAMAHDRRDDAPEHTLAYVAETFDRLVAASPEASVALYSLGSPDLLAAATDEVVQRMADWGLLGPDRDALDLGCGIGRFLQALAPRLRHIVGIDLSAGMVAEAAARCRDLPNVRVLQGTGRDLAGIPDASLDLVLAADTFPYLVQAGGDVPARHVAEFARVLRADGAVLILNYSYRSDSTVDGCELAELAHAGGLTVETSGLSPFRTWDAAAYLLRKGPAADPPLTRT